MKLLIVHIVIGFVLGLATAIGIAIAGYAPTLSLYICMMSQAFVTLYISFELAEHDKTKFRDIIITFWIPYTATLGTLTPILHTYIIHIPA